MRTDHDRSPSPTDASSTTAPQQVPSTPRELLVGGRWRAADSRARMAVVNPATEQTLAEVADAGPEDARAAAEGLAQAQPHWARTSARERSEILYRAFSLMVERTDELALLMTLEMGKPLAEARGEVAYAAEFFRWFAEEAVRIDGSFGDRPDGTARSLVMKQPVGPSLLITPWNFPLAMGSRKLGPALAAGCTALLKPAPQTPLSSLALAQILIEAGLPPQTLAVLPTSRAEAVVPELMSSGVFRKLSFTGSTEVGKLLLAQASANVMRTSMELGGNAPFIVLDDADLDVAVEAAFQAKMRNMGEACTAANRIFVHRSVAEPFAAGLADRLGGLTVGDGTQPGVDVGPLIDAASRDKVTRLLQDAVGRGAEVLTGGGTPPGPGYFVEPTVLSGVDPQAALMSTEIFGPLAAVTTFESIDEVVARANATPWGLVAYVMTTDIDRAFYLTERLETGMVGLNTGVVSTPSAPFGGVKESGLGREGGRTGIEEFLETKYLSIPRRTPIGAHA